MKKANILSFEQKSANAFFVRIKFCSTSQNLSSSNKTKRNVKNMKHMHMT